MSESGSGLNRYRLVSILDTTQAYFYRNAVFIPSRTYLPTSSSSPSLVVKVMTLCLCFESNAFNDQ
jgi:hypothetical protein